MGVHPSYSIEKILDNVMLVAYVHNEGVFNSLNTTDFNKLIEYKGEIYAPNRILRLYEGTPSQNLSYILRKYFDVKRKVKDEKYYESLLTAVAKKRKKYNIQEVSTSDCVKKVKYSGRPFTPIRLIQKFGATPSESLLNLKLYFNIMKF